MNIFNNDSPLYLQLRKHIEEQILEKRIPEEAAIPSIRELARQYQLNPLTVGNALGSLVDEGVLYKRRGVGFFVAKGARGLIIKNRSGAFVEEELKPAFQRARQLEIPFKEVLEMIETIYGEKDE
ncbi:MAG: GntR family transcriptional regulator [Candidatus Cloacimonadaceae bacterium]|jgi:DNA-binding transcriptional regulator YhcF (GntR family)|nr:GntR family transcriptional regulator [Candidatus Cloacimonadota bacterium]MDX9949633.1 GntR family transcriptional regulator [Candidatus Syntrophosphaera sp.]NLN85728.1 GntR family transcriptional regulator [Candidatus Cloacimonadota bacterium]